jgi:hypothetical protein
MGKAWMPQPAQRLFFKLTNPLSAQPEFVGDFLQCMRLTAA